MDYKNQALKGVSWVGAFRASTRGIAFLRTLVLARILSPLQFGVFGIASLTITFLEILMETGVNVVLIQKKQAIDNYINTAWIVSILRGFIITIILLLSANIVSAFFNSPESASLIYLISLVSLIRGFINPSIVRFQKEMRFKEEFWFKFTVFAFDSAVAIAASYYFQSAVGIVWGLIAGAMFELIASFIFITPRPKFEFDAKKVREVLSKGKWITGAGVFQFLFRQGDDAFVGRVLGEGPLGIYQLAYKVASLPVSEVTDVFGRVTFPMYVKISDDKTRLKSVFFKTTGVVALLALVVGGILFVFGGLIVETLLGESWSAAVPLVKVLSIFGIIQAISNSFHSFLLAIEKQSWVTTVTFFQTCVMLIIIFPLTNIYGLWGAALSPLIGSLAGLSVMFVMLFMLFNNNAKWSDSYQKRRIENS